MFRLGVTELLIILAVILLLFGVGRVTKIAKELGGGIRSFREGLQGENKESDEEKKEEKK